MEQNILQFVPFTTLIDIGFWTTLAKKKIEEYKLDDGEQQIIAKYKVNNYKEKCSNLIFDVYSFEKEITLNASGPLEIFHNLKFKNFNTIEQYREIDTIEVIQKMSQTLLEEFKKETKPTLINGNLHMFADLKKYIFTYRMSIPQFKIEGIIVEKQEELLAHLGENTNAFIKELQSFLTNNQKCLINSPFYIMDKKDYKYIPFEEYISQHSENKDNYIIVYFDSFNQSQINGTFANLLTYLKTNPVLNKTNIQQFIIIKDFIAINANKIILKNSTYLQLDLSKFKLAQNPIFGIEQYVKEQTIDLRSFMDEKIIATEAVDLNIKLMKWRLLPQLDLDKIKSTKCLLVGAGTLGCQLSRNLIGWGIRHITFVDYGKVSYSNPVRQTLYDFEDSTNGGKQKAETAAIKLKKIFPDIVAEGYSLEIPMPGHYVTEAQVEQTLKNLQKIDELVKEHDVVFLLTDSRESRWLPTVLANKYNKICFAVALGFDSFLVIRHGISLKSYNPEIHGERLACYFCNDFSAPQNSMKDRTLDQQCTVTRPGLSFLAAAYSSELLISLIHHELRDGAPASDNPQELQTTDLGLLPHFIRGQLSDFDVRLFYGKSFSKCVACSQLILDEYEKNPEQFILQTLNRPDYLQDVTGITEEINKMASEPHQIEEIDDFAIIQ